MNTFELFTKPVIGGFYAYLRTAGDAEARPLLNKGGFPKTFEKEIDAMKEATSHLLRYINGHLVRDGEIAGHTAAAAESTFKLVKQKGKTKQITVTYKRGLAPCDPAKKSFPKRESDRNTQSAMSISPGFFGSSE